MLPIVPPLLVITATLQNWAPQTVERPICKTGRTTRRNQLMRRAKKLAKAEVAHENMGLTKPPTVCKMIATITSKVLCLHLSLLLQMSESALIPD
jgi:hypothetical protein